MRSAGRLYEAPKQLEIVQLKRDVISLKAARDISKKTYSKFLRYIGTRSWRAGCAGHRRRDLAAFHVAVDLAKRNLCLSCLRKVCSATEPCQGSLGDAPLLGPAFAYISSLLADQPDAQPCLGGKRLLTDGKSES